MDLGQSRRGVTWVLRPARRGLQSSIKKLGLQVETSAISRQATEEMPWAKNAPNICRDAETCADVAAAAEKSLTKASSYRFGGDHSIAGA